MVDYYALPQGESKGWPGRDTARGTAAQKAEHVETALKIDIAEAMGKNFRPQRFVPYVVMHEFEALLFSDCRTFSDGIGKPELGEALQAMRDEFDSPEEINDSPITAPSKRIEGLIPGYEKPFLGVLGVLSVGLGQIRAECAGFNGWLARLEKVAGQS